MNEIKVVSFDFDNTIGYLDPPAHATISTILNKHGINVNSEKILATWTKQKSKVAYHPLMEKKGWGLLTEDEKNTILFENNRYLLEELGIQSNLDVLARTINDEWFAERRLYQDVPRAFKKIKETGILIAILAGPSSKTIKNILNVHNLLEHISCFATSDILSLDFGPLQKKDGSAYRYLIHQLNVEPNNVMHVGDNLQLDSDVPRSLGITAVLINRNNREDLIYASQTGHTVIQNLDELLHFIDSFFC